MGEITQLLEQARAGHDGAWDQVVALLYDDLRRLAWHARGTGRPDTLNATALVHECWLRLAREGGAGIANRAHFFALAGRAMRQILANHARDRLAAKRGGGAQRTTLDRLDIAADREAEDIARIDAALTCLADEDERLVRVVDCRVFGGFSEAETAEALGLPLRTVQRLWARARDRLGALLA
jgi:RNA polymerase sigma factor (TIGR02999 family)